MCVYNRTLVKAEAWTAEYYNRLVATPAEVVPNRTISILADTSGLSTSTEIQTPTLTISGSVVTLHSKLA